MPEWTPKQRAAIQARNRSILVSAAAGSGKTTVLIERIMALLREGVGIEHMLVVTFTRAAASEMRERLQRVLTEEARSNKALKAQRDRLGTILWTLAQVVTDLNTMLSPFLPHSANQVNLVMGGSGGVAPMPRIEEVTDLDVTNEDGSPRTYPIITGDYVGYPTWERHPVLVGREVHQPHPVFTKLDDSIVEEELGRAGA